MSAQTCEQCGRQGTRGFEQVPGGGVQCATRHTCANRREAAVRAAQRFQRKNYGSGHGYTLDGFKMPGVTTVIKMKATPALTNWAARMAAEFALDNWPALERMSPADRYKALSNAHNVTRNRAAVRGTRIHSFGEKLAHGADIEVPDEYRGPAEAYARFLDRWEITAMHTEVPVCHTGYRYGGTLDLIASSPKLVDGEPFVLDVKTGKGFYRETAMQLAAYRFCDLAMIDGLEAAMPATDERAFGAHVGPDDVELLPVDAGEVQWRTFLHLLAVHRWDENARDEPPVGRAIWPEAAA